jgi:hypothetical protein
VLDPQAVLSQAGQGRAPPTWRVFTKERGRVRGFLRGTSADPDPLLVITPDGVAEYTDSRKPTTVVDFDSLSRIRLRVSGSTFSDSIQVRLDVWLDLHYRDHRASLPLSPRDVADLARLRESPSARAQLNRPGSARLA